MNTESIDDKILVKFAKAGSGSLFFSEDFLNMRLVDIPVMLTP